MEDIIDTEEIAPTFSSYCSFAVLTWQKLRQLKGNKRYFFNLLLGFQFVRNIWMVRITFCPYKSGGKNKRLLLLFVGEEF